MKDLARDHVWRYDWSPARALERQQSMERTFALAMGDRQPTRAPTQGHTPARQRPPVRQRLQGKKLPKDMS